MRATWPILLVVFLLLAACAPVAAEPGVQPLPVTARPLPAEPTQGHLPNVDFMTYRNAALGFSMQFPRTWRTTDESANPVIYSLAVEPGTALVEKRLEILTTPNAATCQETTYDSDTGSTSPEQVTINGIDFLKETGSGIAAGNIYDWTAYSVMKGSTCINVTYLLHSVDVGVYSTDPAPFDKDAEMQAFDVVMATFKFD